jgi:TonB family protein
MKNLLFFILLFMPAMCLAQKTVSKADSIYNEPIWASLRKADSANSVCTFLIDQMPQFPGGLDKLTKFLGEHIKYPKAASMKRIEGTVYAAFIVGKDGSISNIITLRDIGYGCGDEVVRVIKLIPKWIPGKNNGEDVNFRYFLPVDFQL